MKELRKISKEYYLRQIVCCWLVFCMTFVIPAGVAMADTTPAPGTLPSGLIDRTGINAPVYTPGRMDMTQTAGEAIVNWTNFDIGSGATVEFHQPGATAAVLNRVHDGVGTGIMGTLIANGRVFIINPAGIVFGSGAHINIPQLVASSLKLHDDDFLNGAPYQFYDGHAATGDVVFNAHADNVHAYNGVDKMERLYLIGKNVRNKGGLVARDFAVMAAGDTVTISEPDSSVLVEVDMGGYDPKDFEVRNEDEWGDWVATKLEADNVILAAGDLWSQAISNVKRVEITSTGSISSSELSDIDASSGPGSEAVAEVVIKSDSDITIDDDIKAVADGEGLGDHAIARVTIDAGGDVEIKSASSGKAGARATTVEAIAHDGVENHADVKITAEGDVRLLAPDKVTVVAEAYGGEAVATLNEANVEVDAVNVEVKAQDTGISSEPAEIVAIAYDGDENRAKVDIDADGYVEIIGDGGDDVAQLIAEAMYGSENYADVIISAVGDVDVLAKKGTVQTNGDGGARVVASAHEGQEEDGAVLNKATINIDGRNVTVKDDAANEMCGQEDDAAEVVAEAYDGDENIADVTITATSDDEGGGNVKVIGKDGGTATVLAQATNDDESNTANVTVTTNGGDVLVHGVYGDASIEAKAYDGYDNTATIAIDAVGGDVKVIDIGEGGDNTSKIEAEARDAENSNTADVTINVTAVEVIEEVEVEKGVFEDVVKVYGGDVEVKAKDGGNAAIQAGTFGGYTSGLLTPTNDSDVLICADGAVLVEDDGRSVDTAAIKAIAHLGEINNAYVGIGAGGSVGVIAGNFGHASITAEAFNIYEPANLSNIAETIVCTKGGVDVIAENGGDASILALAKEGVENDAYVAVCAVDDVVVRAGNLDTGCEAKIVAKAEAKNVCAEIETTTDAQVHVTSHNGGVGVVGLNGGKAKIQSFAWRGNTSNKAYTGVSAGGDLLDDCLPGDHPFYEYTEGLGLGVLVAGLGPGSEAKILADAYGYGGEKNTADTVVCTPDIVGVLALGDDSFAQIKSRAGRRGDNPEEVTNKATTQVYAGDVGVYIQEGPSRGRGIWAYAGGAEVQPHVPGEQEIPGRPETPYDWYCMTEHGEVAVTNGSATLIIGDYGDRQDCPDCPPCPCEQGEGEEAALFAPVASLAQFEIPRIEGCPELTQAAAMELGITAETIQVAIGNALALNPTIQPCEACATLMDAAAILRDEDGSRMAAMVQAFNALAPADAPFTPEMATSVAMAFEGAAEGTQYASVREYIDAFVQYATALDTLGAPVGDSVAFVMGKHGAGVSDNASMAAFVATRLEAIGE